MNITIEDGHFRCEFRYSKQLVERIKQVSGATWDKEARCWFVPLQQGDKLIETFPKASYSYEALCACWDAEKRRTATFADNLARWGIQLVIDDSGAIVAVGDNVSPLLQDMVRERSEALRAWVCIELPVVELDDSDVQQTATAEKVEVTKGDRLLWAGMQNAAKREAEQRQMRSRVYRRRMLEQAELFGDRMAQVEEGN